jgi:hypothetical protein
MLPTLTADRLSEREQYALLIRLGFCDGGRYVVEPDGTFRSMRPEDEQERTGGGGVIHAVKEVAGRSIGSIPTCEGDTKHAPHRRFLTH